MQPSRKFGPTGKNKRFQGTELLADAINVPLNLVDLPFGNLRRRPWRCQFSTQFKQTVLNHCQDATQQRMIGFAASQSEMGIQLIDATDGLNPQRVLFHSFGTEQFGSSVITFLGIELHFQSLAFDRTSRFWHGSCGYQISGERHLDLRQVEWLARCKQPEVLDRLDGVGPCRLARRQAHGH